MLDNKIGLSCPIALFARQHLGLNYFARLGLRFASVKHKDELVNLMSPAWVSFDRLKVCSIEKNVERPFAARGQSQMPLIA